MYTYEQWNALSQEEQEKIFPTLSRREQRQVWSYHHQVIPRDISSSQMSPELRKRTTEWRRQMVKEGKLTQARMDELERQ